MKTLVSITLLSILLLQAGGMLFVFKCRQYAVRNEMQHMLEEKKMNFQKVKLSQKEFRKNKINSHEIILQDNIFDFKIDNQSQDQIELSVVYDSKEESILKDIKDFANRACTDNSNLPDQLQQLLAMNYFSPESLILNCSTILVANLFYFSESHFNSFETEISPRPPKLG